MRRKHPLTLRPFPLPRLSPECPPASLRPRMDNSLRCSRYNGEILANGPPVCYTLPAINKEACLNRALK